MAKTRVWVHMKVQAFDESLKYSLGDTPVVFVDDGKPSPREFLPVFRSLEDGLAWSGDADSSNFQVGMIEAKE